MSENDFSTFPTFLEYIDQVLHLRSARIVKRRAKGASLRDVALEEGLTRTEVRQQEKKALNRLFETDPVLQEDAYRYLYEHYNMDQEFFDGLEAGSVIRYYLKSRYDAGFMAMANALTDRQISESVLRRLQAYYNALNVMAESTSGEEDSDTASADPVSQPSSCQSDDALVLRELPAHILESIDELWEIFFTGGITDDLEILEQISIFLFLKVLDDRELENTARAFSEGTSVTRHYFDEAHQDCRWTYFHHLEALELYEVVKDRAFPYIRKELRFDTQITYAKLSKELKLQILDAPMMARIVTAIDNLTAISSVRLFQLFDAMIARAFPPDGTLELICRLAPPSLEDTICNPFMDLTHHLSFFADYVKDTYPDQLQKVWYRTHFYSEMFYGFSNANDQTVLSIAALRMLLRNIESAAYRSYDVLCQTPDRKYTRIITEIPSGATINTRYVKASIKNFISANQPIPIHMYACHELLEDNGIGALIVPHRALTENSVSHRKLRSLYVDENNLLAIINIPESRRDILIYQKCLAPEDGSVWFARMDQANDAEEYITSLTAAYFDQKAVSSREEACFRVPLTEIRENRNILDYDVYSEASSADLPTEEPTESFDSVMRRIYNTQAAIDTAIQEIKAEMEGLS